MPLFQCGDCGGNVSTKALACPGCGRMVRGRGWWATTIGWGVIMSAVISFLLGILLTVGFVALIGGPGAVGSYTNRAPQATPTPLR